MNHVSSRIPLPSQRRVSRLLAALLMTSAAFVGAVAIATPAHAQELTDPKPPKDRSPDDRQRDRNADDNPTRAELKKRFEARFDQLNDLKDKSLIGETYEGYVEPLESRLLSKDERKLVEDENADRKALYGLIADRVDEGKEKVPPRVVAERNARRNFEKADARHYLKISEGRWIQKRDEARAEKNARLKKEGVVGETYEGYLEAVKGKGDDEVQQLIEEENRARRALYDEIAGRVEKANAEQIARNAAKDIHEHLPAGHYYKSKEGAWERRPERQR